MQKIKVVKPVIGFSIKNLIENYKIAQSIANLVEIRADSLGIVTKTAIKALFKELQKNTIFTISKRSIKDGGWYSGTEESRIECLIFATELGFSYVDIELDSFIKNNLNISSETKLVLSKHYFKNTPELKILDSIINKALQYKPDVIKIATQVLNNDDLSKIYQLLLRYQNIDTKVLIIGMGKLGKETRIIGPILNSSWAYSATPTEPLAPGHIGYNKMVKIFRSMDVDVG